MDRVTPSITRALLSAAVFLACALTFSTAVQGQQGTKRKSIPRSPVSYEQLVNSADKLVRQGRYVQALAVANKAIKIKPEDYKGHYYVAFSLFKSDMLAEAKPVAEKARELAPPDAVQDVERLVTAIGGAEQSKEKLAAAEKALNDSDFATAAVQYDEAYRAMPTREDLGFKAAEIYLRLNNPQKSLDICRELLLKANAAATTSRANNLIAQAEALQSKIAEDNRLEAERQERVRREREEREERARREQQAREREQQAREEREERQRQEQARQAKRAEIRQKIEDLRDEVERETSAAEMSEEYLERMQTDYQNCLSRGDVACGILKIGVDKFQRDAREHRRKVAQLEREISRWQSQLP